MMGLKRRLIITTAEMADMADMACLVNGATLS